MSELLNTTQSELNLETESEAAYLNRTVVKRLQRALEEDPEADLLSIFPKSYASRMESAERFNNSLAKSKVEPRIPHCFLTRLEPAESAIIVQPLSNTVNQLLAKYADSKSDDDQASSGRHLSQSLKKLLHESPKLWESSSRGVVVKCSEEIVAKVLYRNDDYTEYTALQYLADQNVDIPAPKPHGLVNMAPFKVLFMTFIPSITLAEAWPNLTQENKFSIQQQLDEIFSRLRTQRMDDGKGFLGGPGKEGVKDHRHDLIPHRRIVCRTGAEFEDFQFDIPHRGTPFYDKLLRGLLPEPARGSVFSHGDVRPENIMVRLDGDTRSYVVSGIIDWEDAGFYPEHFESTQLTTTLRGWEDTDWWLYVPPCIAPSRYPGRWLLDRVWGYRLIAVGAVL